MQQVAADPTVVKAAVFQNNADIFAANRATGHIALSVAAAGARTRRQRVFEDGPLRVRFPNAAPESLEAVIVNTGGGMTGGDRFTIELTVGEGASLIAGTTAAEKIYRSSGPDAETTVRLKLCKNARLAWLPQETIMFDNARLSRRIEIDLGPGASLLMAEAIVLGRTAMGEAMKSGLFADLWRVRREGRLIFADGVRLDGDIAAKLAAPAVTAGGIAMATLLVAPGTEAGALLQTACERLNGCGGSNSNSNSAVEAAVSTWNGVAVARLCARNGAALRDALVFLLAAIGQDVPRLWLQ
jgi:urease accessory protein